MEQGLDCIFKKECNMATITTSLFENNKFTDYTNIGTEIDSNIESNANLHLIFQHFSNNKIDCNCTGFPAFPLMEDSSNIDFWTIKSNPNLTYIGNYILEYIREETVFLHFLHLSKKMEGKALTIQQSEEIEYLYFINRMEQCAADSNFKEQKHLLILFFHLMVGIIQNNRIVDCNKQTALPSDLLLHQNFKCSLKANFRKMKSVAEYAKLFFMTPNYFNSRIKKASGFSASFHIQQHLLSEVEQLLQTTHFSQKEIAYHLGYDDIAYFSRLFKKICGICFTEFKQKFLLQNAILLD